MVPKVEIKNPTVVCTLRYSDKHRGIHQIEVSLLQRTLWLASRAPGSINTDETTINKSRRQVCWQYVQEAKRRYGINLNLGDVTWDALEFVYTGAPHTQAVHS